jgi:pyruvate dehydrogenase E1 component alpha subunit
MERKRASEAELKQMDSDIRATINKAAEFAQSEPEPVPDELWSDVYLDAQTAAVREG